MDNTFTHQDLIKFLYGELSFEQTAELYNQLDKDMQLEEALQDYIDVYGGLKRIRANPSEDTIQNILKFSREQSDCASAQ